VRVADTFVGRRGYGIAMRRKGNHVRERCVNGRRNSVPHSAEVCVDCEDSANRSAATCCIVRLLDAIARRAGQSGAVSGRAGRRQVRVRSANLTDACAIFRARSDEWAHRLTGGIG
jgi:hypothetical protein